MIESALGGVKKYTPERDYLSREYKPIGKRFDDLCGHCTHYYKNLNKSGLTNSEFPVKCKGNILETIKGLEVDDFDSEEEYSQMIIAADPVAWSYYQFGWEAHWYQEELLECSASKRIIRAGRRLGKTEALCVLALYKAMTNSNFSILIIAPFQAQVNLIWDKMNEFIGKSVEVSESIRRNTRSPEHRIEFNNGSKMIGFCAGPNSGSKSDKVRGQDANFIILDEADYLADEDIQTILAILASHPNCGMWASSTPTGKHKKFYQWATIKDLGFKEFHYISAESPRWTSEAEDYFRNDYTSTAFEHEFYAEFGIQEAGVFRNDLIDASIADYSLPRIKTPNARVVMGVDWNGQEVGVHIVVVEVVTKPNNGVQYVLLEKRVIRAEEYTQHKAIEEIVILDELYDADFIYVDAGYGEMQVEMLRKLGVTNPSRNYQNKIRAYAMQSSVEIKDPVTQQMVKKQAKPFMVNCTAIQLECGRLLLPTSEDTKIFIDSKEGESSGKQMSGIVQQMRNFSIERYSGTGAPVYSQGEEHSLTAYMLAITGFLLEFSDMRQARVDSHVRFVSRFKNTEEANEPNAPVGEVVRQLEVKGGRTDHQAGGIYSIVDQGKYREDTRRLIAQGNKRAIHTHFNSAPNRNASFGSGSRRTF